MKMYKIITIGIVSIMLCGTNSCGNSNVPSQEVGKSTPLDKNIARIGLVKMMKSERYFNNGTTFIDWSERFEDIVQYSENEATMIVNFNIQDTYARNKLKLKFKFKKSMNDVWIVAGVEDIDGVGSEKMRIYIDKLNKLEVACQ